MRREECSGWREDGKGACAHVTACKSPMYAGGMRETFWKRANLVVFLVAVGLTIYGQMRGDLPVAMRYIVYACLVLFVVTLIAWGFARRE